MAAIATTVVPSRQRRPRLEARLDIIALTFYNLTNSESEGLKPMIGNPGSKNAT